MEQDREQADLSYEQNRQSPSNAQPGGASLGEPGSPLADTEVFAKDGERSEDQKPPEGDDAPEGDAPGENSVKSLESTIVDGARDFLKALLDAAEGNVDAVVPLIDRDSVRLAEHGLPNDITGTLEQAFEMGHGAKIVGMLNANLSVRFKAWAKISLAKLDGISSSL